MCTGIASSSQDDPAKEVEDGQDDGDDDGGSLGGGMVDDAREEGPLALADEEWTERLPDGRKRGSDSCNQDYFGIWKGVKIELKMVRG